MIHDIHLLFICIQPLMLERNILKSNSKAKKSELDLQFRNAHESTYNNTPATAKKNNQTLATDMQIFKWS